MASQVERQSALAPAYRPGSHGNVENGIGVILSETRPASIVQAAAWPGEEKAVIAAIKKVTGLTLPDGAGGGISDGARAAFGFAPGRFTVAGDDDDLAVSLAGAIPASAGTVTDLSHGRTAIRVEGPDAEWVLAKLFALDFSATALPLGAGRSTTHHDMFAQIQRTGADRFDIYVFRSFARSFWRVLCHASEEVGYEVQ